MTFSIVRPRSRSKALGAFCATTEAAVEHNSIRTDKRQRWRIRMVFRNSNSDEIAQIAHFMSDVDSAVCRATDVGMISERLRIRPTALLTSLFLLQVHWFSQMQAY